MLMNLNLKLFYCLSNGGYDQTEITIFESIRKKIINGCASSMVLILGHIFCGHGNLTGQNRLDIRVIVCVICRCSLQLMIR